MFKYSYGYDFIRFLLRFVFKAFYRKIIVNGLENIPNDKPIIFAPNHQNALMDPLAVIFTNPNQTIFLTRADIFKRPLLLKIFTYFKMLPVYRVRDGVDSLGNNEEIFRKCVDILKHKKSIALFPEASHNSRMFLLPLKKAVPRIAFQAEVENDFKLDVQIVPVGIYYDNYTKTNALLTITYGKPLAVAEYKKHYEENPQKCLNELRINLSKAIKPLIVDFEIEEDYVEFETIGNLIWESKSLKNGTNKFQNFQHVASKLKELKANKAETYEKLISSAKNFGQLKNKNINEKSIFQATILKTLLGSLLLLISLPIFLFGLINNILYYFLMNKMVLSKIKDQQFHSSIKYVVAGVLLPLIYIIHSAIVLLISGSFSFALLYFISLPLGTYIANKVKTSWSFYKSDLLYLFSSKEYKSDLIAKAKDICQLVVQR